MNCKLFVSCVPFCCSHFTSTASLVGFKIASTIRNSHLRPGCFVLPLLSLSSSLTPVTNTQSRAGHMVTTFFRGHSQPHLSNNCVRSANMSSSSPDTREQKQALRMQIRSRMKELSPDDIATQSVKVWERLFALAEYKQANSVGLFLSMPKHEIDTDIALVDAIHNNKTVYVPQVGKNFELAEMDLIKVILPENVSATDRIFHQDWPRNKWGIPEPSESMPRVAAAPGDIDLLVVPGLAFDAHGGRLGQGKGYYDRFIARMRKDSKKPLLVAVGLDPQLVDHIPVTEFDFCMDIVLLPNQTVIVRRD